MDFSRYEKYLIGLPAIIPFFFGNVTNEQRIIISLAIFAACLLIYCINLNVKLDNVNSENKKLTIDIESIREQKNKEGYEANNIIKDTKIKHSALSSILVSKNEALAEYEVLLQSLSQSISIALAMDDKEQLLILYKQALEYKTKTAQRRLEDAREGI